MGRPSGPTRDTKRLICERALEVFAEKGYAATTMRDVAAAVGMRDASLYSHFPGKQAIFDAAVEHQLDRLTQDKKTLLRINALLKDIARTGGTGRGRGKSELLRPSAEGLSSVRIDAKNRLTYKVEDGIVRVISCRGHYEDR